jgi:tripeptide aminopeptidase
MSYTPPSRTTTTSGYKWTTFPEIEFDEQRPVKLNEELLTSLVQVQGKSRDEGDMQQAIWDYLVGLGLTPECDKNGNLYCQKGEAAFYPTMVAHMDTVHMDQKAFSIHKSNDGKILYAFNEHTGEQAGIGGDDRCGIYVALHLLTLFPAFKVCFFVEEEIGGAKGSGACDMSFFSDSSVVLQCDRKGHDDWVRTASGTKLASDEFIASIDDLLKGHNYSTTTAGGFTDVVNLKTRGLNVCAANMSCGYYNPHSSKETIHLPALENTLNLCHQVLTLVGETPQPHEHVKYVAPARTNYAQVNTQNSTYEQQRKDPNHMNFSPSCCGWVYIANPVGQGVTAPGMSRHYVKDVNGTKIGPFNWTEVKNYEVEQLKKLTTEETNMKEAKKKMREWIDWDGTWEFDKSKKEWHKVLSHPHEKDAIRYIVGYCKSMLNVQSTDAKWHQNWGDWEEIDIQTNTITHTPHDISVVETRLWKAKLAEEALKAKEGDLFQDKKDTTMTVVPKEEPQKAITFGDHVVCPDCQCKCEVTGTITSLNDDPAVISFHCQTCNERKVQKQHVAKRYEAPHRDIAADLGDQLECPTCGKDCGETYAPQYNVCFCAVCNDWWYPEGLPTELKDKEDSEDGNWKKHWGMPLLGPHTVD